MIPVASRRADAAASAPARPLVLLVRLYQRLISPLLPPSCRFHPSCSQYAVEALTEHGAWRGTALTMWRLVRCGPWHPGGIDPVPPRPFPDVDVRQLDRRPGRRAHEERTAC